MANSVLIVIYTLVVMSGPTCPEVTASQSGAVCAPVVVFELGGGCPRLAVGDDFQYDALGIARTSTAARSRERASDQWGIYRVSSRSVIANQITDLPMVIERHAVLRL